MKSTLLLFCSICLFLSCNSQTSKGVEVIPPSAFAEKMKLVSNPQLIDVRTPEEFASEHIDGAVNINWNGDKFESEATKLEKSEPVFVYCKVGGRSKQAAAKLSELGFTEIYDLQGGIMKWDAAGLLKPDNKMVGITEVEYAKLLKSDKKVLVNFFAEWCAPCKKMSPYIEKMQQEMKGQVAIVRLDADKNKTLVKQLKIDELPVLRLYQDGKMIWEHKGFISEDELKKQL